jgi:branched-subunit amino acid ABC-type transport system permease component
MDWHLLLAQVLAGVANGGLYFLVASGLTLLWGALGVINLAHGSFFMLAAYAQAMCILIWGPQAGYFFGLIVVPLGIALLGVSFEITIFRPVYRTGIWGQLLISFGLVLALNNATRMAFGTSPLSMPPPSFLQGFIEVLGVRLATYQLWILAITALVAVFLWYLLLRIRIGRLIRAAVDDPQMLEAVGVDVRRLRTIVMGIAALLGGIAGAVAVPRGAINLSMDTQIVVIAFAVICIGGLGSVWGTLVAALMIGVAETVATMFVNQGGEIVIFLLMVLVLLVRPAGLRTIVGRE